MTAVLSSAPGPLQLLPTPEYGNGWLKIKDGTKEYSLPRNGNPYSEIYAVGDKWWSMCEAHLINPLNEERHPEKRAAQIGRDWGTFTKLIERVEEFHVAIKSCYHPNTHGFFGSHADQKAFGDVTWQRIGTARAATEPMDARPQNLDQISTTRTVKAPVVGQPNVSLVRHFMIQEPEENGDGTVPHRSGIASQAACKSFLQVNVGHEPAYKHSDGADNLRACRFTLRAIVKIAQDVCAGLISTDTSIGGIHPDGKHDQETKTDIQRGVQAASRADDSRTGLERGRCLPRSKARRDGRAAMAGAGR